MADKERPLTDKQIAFATAYATYFDVTRAAIDAGYSPKSARSQGSQLLNNPNVKKLVEKKLDKYGHSHAVLKKRVLNQLVNAAFFDPIEIMKHLGNYEISSDEFENLPREVRQVISEVIKSTDKKGDEVYYKVKFVNKEKALEMLARHLGMFNDKVEHTIVKPTYIRRYDSDEVIELGAEEVKGLGDGK